MQLPVSSPICPGKQQKNPSSYLVVVLFHSVQLVSAQNGILLNAETHGSPVLGAGLVNNRR